MTDGEQFLLIPSRDADGKEWAHGTDFSKIWDWGYAIAGAPPDPRQYDLAMKVSDAADTIREFGRPNGGLYQNKEGEAAQEIMTDLAHIFSAVLVQKQQADFERSGLQVDKQRRDFFRRVVTPRHRRNLRAPVIATILLMLLALTIGLLIPPKIAPPVVLPATLVQFSALAFIIAGTLMGRLLYFAMSFGERIDNVEQYFEYESISGEAAALSLLFDIIVGAAAFVMFQTGLVIISIGAESDTGFNGISTLQIDENGLVAFAFGIFIGLSRTAFLSRLRDLSKSKIGQGK
ncbi:MAG: hypothetical protein AB3N23_08585 [Paracoccaceae bacterium]